MRMRERPWTGTLPREAPLESHPPPREGGVDAGGYTATRKFPKLSSQLNGREPHLRGPKYRHFNTSYSKLYRSSSELDLTFGKKNTTTVIRKDAHINSVDKTQRFMSPGTASNSHLLGPLGPGRPATSSSNQQFYRSTTSLHVDKKLSDHIYPSFHPSKSVMATNASTLQVASTGPNTWTRNINHADNTPTPTVNNSNGQWSYRDSKSGYNKDMKLTRISQPKDVVKTGIKNSYINLNETILKLRFDRVKNENSTGVSSEHVDDEIRSSDSDRLTVEGATDRRMSAPDLPPITSSVAQNGDKRKISFNSVASTGMNASDSHHTKSFSSKTSYSRRSSTATADVWTDAATAGADQQQNGDRASVSGNQNESRHPNLMPNRSSRVRIYCSSSSLSPTSQRKASACSRSQGSGSKNGDTSEVNKLTGYSRCFSLSATDVQEPQEAAERQFENMNSRKNIGSSNSTNKFTMSKNNTSTTNVNNTLVEKYNIYQSGVSIHKSISSKPITTKNSSYEMPSIVRSSRSVSMNRNNSNEEEDAKQFKHTGITINNKAWDRIEARNVELSKNKRGIVRSKSENQLANNGPGQINTVANRGEAAKKRFFSRNISVDKQGPNSQKLYRAVPPYRVQQGSGFKGMRSESSNNLHKRDGRYGLNDATYPEDEHRPGEDNGKDSARLVEWLCSVNSVAKYEIDPRFEVVDYSDEPPQTDTAIHLVYQGE